MGKSAGSILLLPHPQKLRMSAGRFVLPAEGRICLPPQGDYSITAAGERLISVLGEYGEAAYQLTAYQGSPSAAIRLSFNKAVRHPQGYALRVSREAVVIEARASAGLFYGVCTLVQLIRQFGRRLPCLRIDDWPDIEQRGVMLDISRDKVPTMETLFAMVDLLSGLKVNQLQLYTEHTFAYEGHETVWEKASPMTPQQVLQLQQYCRNRHVQLAPNQNSFGHMERWLKFPQYQAIAELPRGSCLAATRPESIEFMDSLYEQLLPHFESPLFNIGCDETWELGKGQSASACKRAGVGRVYLQFLLKLYKLAKKHGKTPMVWADIINKHPDLIAKLPKDMIMLEWGYEANHPFDKRCRRFADNGLRFYVCPGTSSWCSIAGRTDNCIGNLASAAKAGVKHAAAGFLNTDWGDNGHRQYLPASYVGFGYGAAVSWACRRNLSDRLLADKLSLHVLEDPTGKLGRTLYELGNIDQFVCSNPFNRSALFSAIEAKLQDAAAWRDYSAAGAGKVLSMLKRHAAEVRKARPACRDGRHVIAEVLAMIDLFAHACEKVILARQLHSGKAGPGQLKSAIRRQIRDMEKIMQRHRTLWLARNRPGGLIDSLARYRKICRDYKSTLRGL